MHLMTASQAQKLRGQKNRQNYTRRSSDASVCARRGRPSIYTQGLAVAICERVASGEALAVIAREADMPSYPTIMDWLKTNTDFAFMYRQAREDQADTLADQIISIADSVRDCTDSAKVNAARLACDARKWVAAKLKPKVYGERVEAALSGTAIIEHEVTDEDRAKALSSLIARELIRSAPNMLEAQRLLTEKH